MVWGVGCVVDFKLDFIVMGEIGIWCVGGFGNGFFFLIVVFYVDWIGI